MQRPLPQRLQDGRRRVQHRVVWCTGRSRLCPEAGESAALPEPASSSALSRFVSMAFALMVGWLG